MVEPLDSKVQKLIDSFAHDEKLNERQKKQFADYLVLLISWNKTMNLTALEDPEKIINLHFKDSLIIDRHINVKSVCTIADVGTGAGFPAIPIKIKYPHLKIILIEVSGKKISFLEEVISQLSLNEVQICPLDWRTFLRKTDFCIDIFVTRAALQPRELVRMFAPTCRYNVSTLIYWASAAWQPEKKELPFIEKEINYSVGNKMRKFVFFKKGVSRD